MKARALNLMKIRSIRTSRASLHNPSAIVGNVLNTQRRTEVRFLNAPTHAPERRVIFEPNYSPLVGI